MAYWMNRNTDKAGNKMTNYKAMANRLRKAKTPEALKSEDRALTRIYNAGTFTTSEFMRLDLLLVDCKIEVEA